MKMMLFLEDRGRTRDKQGKSFTSSSEEWNRFLESRRTSRKTTFYGVYLIELDNSEDITTSMLCAIERENSIVVVSFPSRL